MARSVHRQRMDVELKTWGVLSVGAPGASSTSSSQMYAVWLTRVARPRRYTVMTVFWAVTDQESWLQYSHGFDAQRTCALLGSVPPVGSMPKNPSALPDGPPECTLIHAFTGSGWPG